MTINSHRVDAVSSFGDETFAEYTKIDWLSEDEANEICDILNRRGVGSIYYKVRERAARLHRGMDDLV